MKRQTKYNTSEKRTPKIYNLIKSLKSFKRYSVKNKIKINKMKSSVSTRSKIRKSHSDEGDNQSHPQTSLLSSCENMNPVVDLDKLDMVAPKITMEESITKFKTPSNSLVNVERNSGTDGDLHLFHRSISSTTRRSKGHSITSSVALLRIRELELEKYKMEEENKKFQFELENQREIIRMEMEKENRILQSGIERMRIEIENERENKKLELENENIGIARERENR